MILTLTCPAPADARRVSQHERQLAAIGSTLAHHLARRMDGCATQELVVLNESIDNPTSVRLCIGSLELNIEPLFPGSFSCNDIYLHGRLNGKPFTLPAHFSTGDTTVNRHDFLQQIASASDAALLHARYTPLPARLGHRLYRNGLGSRVIIHLGDSDDLSANDSQARLRQLLDQLMNVNRHDKYRSHNNKPSPVYICQLLTGKKPHSPTRNKLAQLLGRPVELLTVRKGQPTDLLSLLVKADFLVSRNTAVVSDAIQLSVPVAMPGTPPTGLEAVQTAFERYEQHLNPSRLIEEQTRALENYRLHRRQIDTICNNRTQLLSLLEKMLAHALPHWQATTPALNEAEPTSPIIEPTDQTTSAEFTQRINLSFERNRRKLIKFRESPGRFLRDSNHPLVRPFQSLF